MAVREKVGRNKRRESSGFTLRERRAVPATHQTGVAGTARRGKIVGTGMAAGAACSGLPLPLFTNQADIHLTLPRAGGSDVIASGEGCPRVIAPEACPPLRPFGPTLPKGESDERRNHALSYKLHDPLAGGSDAIASGEGCPGVIAPRRAPPHRPFGPTLPKGRVRKDEIRTN